MNETIEVEQLKSLGKSEFHLLKTTYCKLDELRAQIARLHETYVDTGKAPDIDAVAALRILADELFAEVDRYLSALIEPAESCVLATPES